MKQLIENLIKNSISSLDKDGSVNPNLVANIRVDRTKDRAHGDFATNDFGKTFKEKSSSNR